ncbi:5'-methylthioadenosine/adenosylhomocysteine nucleosidase [Erysipelothrix sp. HDW6C]|uniref:5'-methylthioadenosine/adenosylhomocysteine nucleosidase n=1 Tax=Erysipelothrix sp. HDW6C TaxID=2714930 RepID=UPI001407B9CA|nr:5'-methylthioadenosine/adenosylhomocysteine nucleosidase [Erysipelothrix sp. HDW6C]QIK70122.1 5'-methylthioadenosine/adenosylhomocysteine nucleosidase [Erysipelothrix sp. HDW6C]
MIVIIGAMIEEVQALTALMEDSIEVDVHHVKTWQGTLSGKSVVVALSGVGKVNAAYTASTLIQAFKPEAVLNIGSAGGLQLDQKVGDIVVATQLQYHDLFIGPDTHTDPRFIFSSNPTLVNLAQDVLQTMDKPYHVGLIVTGDQFITKHQPEFKRIQEVFTDAICVEMEAAAIAAVCQRSKTPFIVLRGLSDVTFEDGNEITFDEYLPVAAKNSALICKLFVDKL